MKIPIPLTTLCLLLFFGAVTALPQQSVPIEKKRAMNNFDPIDVFPEAKEHGRKDRKKREKNPTESTALASNGPTTEPARPSRQRSRHRRSQSSNAENSEAGLAAGLTPTPTPVISAIAVPASSPAVISQTVGATSAPLPRDNLSSNTVMGGASPQTTPPPQSVAAVDNSSSSSPSLSIPPSRQPGLSLPVILSLISAVLLVLVVALASLMKQVRGSVN